jgi:hypothetical protein
MPVYVYETPDGERHEIYSSIVGRSETKTLPDGRQAHWLPMGHVGSVMTQLPAEDRIVEDFSWQVAPNQADEYNRVARQVGVNGADAKWDERGNCHASRSGLKKLNRLREQASRRADDPDFKPDMNAKGIKV